MSNSKYAALAATMEHGRLTPEGKRLMPYIQQILTAEKDMQRLCEELRGVSTGQLTVGTFSSAAIAWMPELTRRFAALHPGISLEIYNDTYSPLEEALLRDQVDCAFVTAPSREEFILYPLYKDRLMAVMDSGCPLSSKARLTAQDLKDLPYIVPAEGTNYDAGKLFLSAGNAVYAFAKGKNAFSMRHNDKSFSFTEGRYVFKNLPFRFQIEGGDLPFYLSTTKLLHTKKAFVNP